jgi:hypothetical protein
MIELMMRTGSGSTGRGSPGAAIVVLGGLFVIIATGALLVWARSAQRHYFRELERIRGINIHDPGIWEMGWSDFFRRRPDYWDAMLTDPIESELREWRTKTLKRAALAVGVLVAGVFILIRLGGLAGYR